MENEVAGQAEVEQGDVTPDFYFKAEADAKGLILLEFVKDGSGVATTLILILDRINASFDTPFKKVSDFVDDLNATLRKIEENQDAEVTH